MAVPKALQSTETDEWYTPKWVIECARSVLQQPFELDPASCGYANKYLVCAERFLGSSCGLDGLQQDWSCRSLWLNPPYGNTKDWINAALMNWLTGQVKEHMFVLVNANVGVEWFNRLMLYSNAVALFRQRIAFIDQNGDIQRAPTHGNALFFFHRDDGITEFQTAFEKDESAWVLPTNKHRR